MQAIEVEVPTGYELDGAWSRRLQVRPWCAADLDLLAQLHAAAPAVRVTMLLGRCCRLESNEIGDDFARALTVGDRVALLLNLRRASRGNRLDCLLTCSHCGEMMDLELAVTALLLPPYATASRHRDVTVTEGGKSYEVRFRLPDGSDEEAAAERAAMDPEGAARLVLERCIESVVRSHASLPSAGSMGSSEIPARVLDQVADLLSEADPQAELHLEATCAGCDRAVATELDVSGFVLAEIERERRRLYREVHVLALAYHWSEREILDMPAPRRKHYLELLAEAAEGAA